MAMAFLLCFAGKNWCKRKKIDPTWDVPEGRIDGELLMGLDLLLMARL